MKLFDYRSEWDFGDDYHIRLLRIKDIWFIQSHFYGMVYGRGFPYLSITMGSGRLLGISFQVLQVGFAIEFFSRSWYE